MRARREPSISFGLSRSPGVIDWMIAWMRSISFSSKFSSWSRNWPIPGSIPMIFGHRAELADLLHLLEEVVEREVAALEELLGRLGATRSSSKVFSACSIRVSMSPMSRMREAIRSGWKRSKSVIFSPAEANMTGLPVIAGDREGRATAGVAVELGEDDAVVADAVEEQLGRGDGVLADHRVDDEQHLVGLHRVADVGGLLHQLRVDTEATGGVDDDDVVQLALGVLDRARGPRRPGRRRRCRASGAKTGTPTRSPLTWSCWTALGRCRSAATRIGVLPCSLSHSASFAASVVLPAPWRPASMMTVGPVLA